MSVAERTPLLSKPPANGLADTSAAAADAEGEGGLVAGREVEVYVPGKSSFTQTLLNTLGDIIGTGLLVCPIAIAHAGWVLGPTILLLNGALTLWTLKILLRIIEKDRRLRSFTDLMAYALGPRGELAAISLFFVEIWLWLITIVVLFSDSLEAVWPIYTSNQWKFIGLIVIIPTSFLPLRYLSFSSALGITATWTLVGILLFTGIATPHSPGSLREPAPTDLWPPHGLIKLGTVFGLLISGFGGHGLIPNLVHDMRNPKRADRACELAYVIAMAVYLLVAICGYLMYGRDVADEVSKDLARTPGFSPLLQKLAVWMVAINPLTKISLGLRPLADIFFTYFHLHPTVLIPATAPTPHVTVPNSPALSSSSSSSADLAAIAAAAAGESHISLAAEARHNRHERLKAVARPIVRVLLACVAVAGAILLPSFESVLGLVGSGLMVLNLIIMPVWAGASVFGWRWYDVTACVACTIIAVVGTVAALWSAPTPGAPA
ncbi:hypothetical protein Q5752_001605 [Cryptotrichosporon argae]